MEAIVDRLILRNNGTMDPGTGKLKEAFTSLPRIPKEEELNWLQRNPTPVPTSSPNTVH
jgi:hypothetical protein